MFYSLRTKSSSETAGEEGAAGVNENDDEVPSHKPHFLDYDAVPPPEFENDFAKTLTLGSAKNLDHTKAISFAIPNAGEHLKLEKKYERDGEISDYELAASGYTKKEFTQDDNTLHLTIGDCCITDNTDCSTGRSLTSLRKVKHVDGSASGNTDEHRNLDSNVHCTKSSSPLSLRRCTLDHVSVGLDSFREYQKKPSYTLSRFLDSDINPGHHFDSLPREINSSMYNSLQVPFSCDLDDLGPKVECVYSLLSMVGSNNSLEMSKKFFELSRTPETCATLRRSGCIPLLVQIMYSEGEGVRKWAGMALRNVVHSHSDEKAGRREAKVIRLLDQIVDYCNFLKTLLQSGGEAIADDTDQHPLAAISSLMKISFDEEHRQAMCELGALQAIPSLVHLDHAVHGPRAEDQCCNSLRRYALMALTNLTFGDESNKALLCSQKLFMEALVAQLDSAPDDLLQVSASVLRNLSWRADSTMKSVLNEIGTVTALAHAAMKNKSENTLKAILSALWNLSAHCSTNKAEFCAVDGALAFLVNMLTYEGPSKTLKIIENAGGILRNVSSHIAVCENYRQILRKQNCLSILLQQLKSESLTVVSNSCGTLWNLSARCPQDQKFLWENGAVPMLRSLINSKHAMISEGSSSALKNLLNFRPSIENQNPIDPIAQKMGLKKLPSLHARKQKALEQELGEKEHMETCDNLDVATEISKHLYDVGEPIHTHKKFNLTETGGTTSSRLAHSVLLTRSESRDSVFSAKSDSVYEHFMRSHSANDTNRKIQKAALITARASPANFIVKNTVESAEERPIDYSVKYNENSTKNIDNLASSVQVEDNPVVTDYVAYQETDLDQPTDFSLRYAENHIESEVDISQPDANVPPSIQKALPANSKRIDAANNDNTIMLVLEDSVKCYQTEDTPYIFSNATSVTDLRQNKTDNTDPCNMKPAINPTPLKKSHRSVHQYGSGLNTPEKPINYCEEGTPGYFSRYESLSSLDESPPQATKACDEKTNVTIPKTNNLKESKNSKAIPSAAISDESSATLSVRPNAIETNPPTNGLINSAQETPLMFSRRSSMDSLVEEDVGPVDDKSSVVSDFSRLASGIISPSEIPDSPTQSMPQSPRYTASSKSPSFSTSAAMEATQFHPTDTIAGKDVSKSQLHSVFEDDLNTFIVENTPAQFSTATSLSNLSLANEDDNLTHKEMQAQYEMPLTEEKVVAKVENIMGEPVLSEGEDEASACHNDDMLLTNCINMGMNRTSAILSKDIKTLKKDNEAKHYFTEEKSASILKSKSNTSLSGGSVCSSPKEVNDKAIYEISNTSRNVNRDSLCLSDDFSSNVSESGAAGQSLDILQQCINIGMKNPNASKLQKPTKVDPIAMLRCGGSKLPQHLPVSDEMTKYLVEDSPCNFSVMSGLSNLTVGSSLVEHGEQIYENPMNNIGTSAAKDQQNDALTAHSLQEFPRREQQWQDDSLSSLSIDSEDDTNLLSQAIAAGCSRPKSNLGLRTNFNSRSSQPIAIYSENAESTFKDTSCGYQSNQNSTKQKNINESYSSVESSDSNENQTKSLFELCILTGMNKSRPANNTSKRNTNHEERSSNLKLFDSLPLNLPRDKSNPTRHTRERKSKDEKLLLECINTGISTKVSGISVNVPIKTSKLNYTDNVLSKNVQPTPVAALAPSHQIEDFISPSAINTAAIGVEANKVTNTSNEHKNKNNNISPESYTSDRKKPEKKADEENLHKIPLEKTKNIGCKEHSEQNDFLFFDSTISESANETNFSEHTYEERRDANFVPSNKHKDPDLMLKSVERLTLEFVTSAEQLRTNSCSETNPTNKAKSSIFANGTDSDNTWNENTCPNDVSFPSVSVSAPGIVSVQSTESHHRDVKDFVEITPTNEELNQQTSLGFLCDGLNVFNNTQPSSLETETDTTLVNDRMDESSIEFASNVSPNIEINFQLGGAVQTAAVASVKGHAFLNNSTMVNSAIIANEARELADNFQQNCMTSMDLDKIRPPSGMDSLNISGYYQEFSVGNHVNTAKGLYTPLSPQFSTKSPKTPRKSLPAGLVARRALGVHISGSAESISLSCNLLDNIKPPSLMDELLDSMISVSSIQSEIADCQSMPTNLSASNYLTATENQTKCNSNNTHASNQSCFDATTLDVEDDASLKNLTPLPSDNDFSSAESSPRKTLPSSPKGIKKVLTPKRKRQSTKDRFKTYTIQANVANDVANSANTSKNIENLEIGSPIRKCNELANIDGEETNYSLTQTAELFKFITMPMPKSSFLVDCPKLANLKECDFNSLECDQNSETESCHNESINSITNIDAQNDEELVEPLEKAESQTIKIPSNIVANEEAQQAKIICGVQQKPTYVSPYSMQYQRKSKLKMPLATATAAQNRTKNMVAPTTSGKTTPINKQKTQATTSTKPTRLERESTFVKDEPTIKNTQMPIVENLSKESPAASKLPSKIFTQIKKTNCKTKYGKIPTPKKPQRSNSNNAISFPATSTRIAIAARVSTTTPPTRSNSNLNSPIPTVSSAQSAKNNKVQSRIASIWRRVDNDVSKPQQMKGATTKQETSTTATAGVKVLQKPGSLIDHNKPPNYKTTRTTTIANKAAMKVTKTSVF